MDFKRVLVPLQKSIFWLAIRCLLEAKRACIANATETARAGSRKVRLWPFWYAIISAHIAFSRSIIWIGSKGWCIKQELFESLFGQGIQLVHGLKAKMKNKLMAMWDKIMLRKRNIIECINELLKNKANLVHSRHRSIHNFIMNLCSALTAYCFFENKPEALPVYVEKSRQLELFSC